MTHRKILSLFIISGLLILACQSTPKPQKPNILLLCIDDLRPELKSFGVDYIHSPHIDQLAATGVRFERHFVNAPSCGPSRFTLLSGRYGPPGNDALFLRAQKIRAGKETVTPTMPEWFKTQGYTTVSVGKVSHHPGGRGGADWNDSLQVELPQAWDKHLMPVGAWEHPRGAMHGLAKGEIRHKAEEMDIFQHAEGDDFLYPDGLIAATAVEQLNQLAAQEQPFFLAVGILKPHLPFGAPKSYYDLYEGRSLPAIEHPAKPTEKTTWHPSGEFMKYNRWGKDPNQDAAFAEEVRRHYAAAVSYADAQVGKVLQALKESGADQNTIVVLWGDHGWHLGEHGIWGKHSLFEEALRSPLIIHTPQMQQQGVSSSALVETLDIFPTLCDLAGLKKPEFAQGTSLQYILEEPQQEGHPVIAYKNDATTLRTTTHRMVLHKDGYVELYDHRTAAKETKNIADQYPEVVYSLKQMMEAKLN